MSLDCGGKWQHPVRGVLIIATLVLLMSTGSLGQPQPLVDTVDFVAPDLRFTFVSEDSSDLETVRALPAGRFQPKGHEKYFPFYSRRDEIWMRTTLQNNANRTDWLFVFDNPLIDEIQVYLLDRGRVVAHQRFGDRFPYREKPVDARPLVLPVALTAGKTYDVFINVDTDGRKTNPVLLVMTPERFFKWEMVKRNELSMLYGLLVLLAVITLYLAWLFRDRVFGWLSAFFLSIFFIYLCTGGFASAYLWPDWPAFGQKAPGVLVYLSVFCALGFCREFLAETVSRLRIDRVLRVLMGLSLVLMVLSFADGWVLYVVIWLMYKTLIVAYGVILITVVYSLYRRQSAALLFMVGISVCIGALAMLEQVDERAGHIFNNGGSVFAFAIGCLLIAFAAIDRLRILKNFEKEMQLFAERERIARDLHDNIGTQLTSLSLGLHQAAKNPRVDVDNVRDLQAHAEATLVELRDTIWVITKNNVTIEQLRDKIESMLWRLQKEHPSVQFTTAFGAVRASRVLTPDQAINLFRIVQEAVNNCLKHSAAKKIVVRLSGEDELSIAIEDDGRGFAPEHVRTVDSYGLGNMRKRAEQLMAHFRIQSRLDEGTTVTVSMPL